MKGLVYYTDGWLNPAIAQACRDRLQHAAPGLRIASMSLTGPRTPVTTWRTPVFSNGGLSLERGYLSMFRQILAGLEELDTDVAFLVEHDVLYHESHFNFTPARDDVYYYNQHVWKVRAEDGHALHYRCSQTSGLCANRALLIEHYRTRVALVEANGFSMAMGFEPGTHGRAERVDDYGAETWMSPVPNVDIRHDRNLTTSRWRKDQFRNQKYTDGWTEADAVPGWEGQTRGRFAAWLQENVWRQPR